MYEVNRSIAVIRPRAAFQDWLKSLPGDLDAELTLEDLRRDCNALLIPASDDYAVAEEFVLQHYRVLFQAELADWCEDDGLWPEELSPEQFSEWFDVEIHTVLTDLVDEPLQREAFLPLDLYREED